LCSLPDLEDSEEKENPAGNITHNNNNTIVIQEISNY
jgi:hypothetical protein